jgi:hypothetical protein
MMKKLTRMASWAFVGLLAITIPAQADPRISVRGTVSSGNCIGALTEVDLSQEPTLTHLQGATGPGDGASEWTIGGVEAAYWDYQGTRDSLMVYLLTGITTQTSCTLTCVLSDEETVAWSDRLVEAIQDGNIGDLQLMDPCTVSNSP